jgi:hypothetical protein
MNPSVVARLVLRSTRFACVIGAAGGAATTATDCGGVNGDAVAGSVLTTTLLWSLAGWAGRGVAGFTTVAVAGGVGAGVVAFGADWATTVVATLSAVAAFEFVS